MEQQGIELNELSSFAAYLEAQYKSSEVGSDYQNKVEQLQYVVNFIVEANEEGYSVKYPTRYIRMVDVPTEFED